jgi:hypothetical protein
MQPLSAQDVIRIWEFGQSRPLLEQAAVMLGVACPDLSPGDVDALSIGEQDARLLALRERTFGPQIDGFAECPRCREPLEFTLRAPDLRAAPAPEAKADDRVITVRGYEVRFRLLTGRDLAAAATCGNAASARRLLAERCVVSARKNGQEVSARRLPESVVARLAARLAECDPQADLALDFACPACGHGWTALLDVAAFFWIELSAYARRLLGEVHTLALAYHWPEADILAMSARRRQAYLDMVGA